MAITPGPVAAVLRRDYTSKGEIPIGKGASDFEMVDPGAAADGEVIKVDAAADSGWSVGPPTDAGSVQKSTLSGKGSLITASAAATPADVPAGTEGAVLGPRSEEAGGVGWVPGLGRSASLVSSGAGPFNLEPTENLNFNWLLDESSINDSVAFAAVAAVLLAGNAETYNLDTLVLNTTKGNVTFAGNGLTAAQVSTQIVSQTTGLAAADDGGGKVELTTDQRGTGASLQVTGGSANAVLGFSTTAVSGTGDVADVDAVTATEVVAVIESSSSADLRARIRTDGLVEAYIYGARSPDTFIRLLDTSTATAVGFDNDYHHASGAQPPVITGTATEPFAPAGGETIDIRVDSDAGSDVTVTIQAGDTTAALMASRVNGTGGVNPEVVASDSGGQLRLTRNKGGVTAAQLDIPAGTGKTLLGFDGGNDEAVGTDGVFDVEVLGSAAEAGITEWWVPPEIPHADDDEFLGGSIGAAWTQDDIVATALDSYASFTTANSVRWSMVNRLGWIQFQAPNDGSPHFPIAKAITLATNELVYTRIHRPMRTAGYTADDGVLALFLGDSVGPPFGVTDAVALYASKSSGGVSKIVAERRDGGTAEVLAITADTTKSEVDGLAIHKIGSDFHFWVSFNGQWRWMAKYTHSSPGNIDAEAFQVENTDSTNGPGNYVVSVDAIRHLETSVFPF